MNSPPTDSPSLGGGTEAVPLTKVVEGRYTAATQHPESNKPSTAFRVDGTAEGITSSPTVIRVRGLPSEKQTAVNLVRDIIDKHIGHTIDYQISIVPSCEWPNESVALVDFASFPAFLSSLKDNPLGSWQTVANDADISFDQHFIGFTQMFEPTVTVQADIIALSGIDGHPYGSWRSRGGLRRMWLRHFLARDLPSCRVLTYGYNAKLAVRSFASAEDYAIEFMEALRMIRQGEAANRPMVFVAHSFGGLILARSIIEAKHLNAYPQLSMVQGILFFAVPHRGIDVEDMSRIMGATDHPRTGLLQHIAVDSQSLKQQLEEFVQLTQDMKIVSFYETEQSRRLVRDEEGHWKRTGEYFTSLQTDNAILQLPNHMETRIPIHQDHSNIVKFENRDDPGYKHTIFQLQRMTSAKASPQNTLPMISELTLGSGSGQPIPDNVHSKSHYMLGQARNRRFVGRQAKLNELEDRFLAGEFERLAIVGLGGVGKTQLALAFCHIVKTKHPDISIFWVSALSKERFQQDYSNIAQHCSLPQIPNKDDAILAVKQYLSSEASGKWLLIVDNADDTRLFDGRLDKISDVLPKSETGKILFTTRHRDAVTGIVDRNLLPLEEMSMEEAETFLKKSLAATKLSEDKLVIEKLLAELAYLPLAIVQAASYMVQKSMNIAAYLATMRSAEPDLIKLLSREFSDNTRDELSSNALATTWLVSFEQIKRDDPEAAELLFFLACIENKSIPASMLPCTADTIGTLRGYSFCVKQDDKELYDMHRLVHLAIKTWMREDKINQARENAIQHLVNILPGINGDNMQQWREYLPHAIRIVQDCDGTQSGHQATVRLKVGMCLQWEGRDGESLAWISECVAWRDQYLAKEDGNRLEAQTWLGDLYRRNGRISESINTLNKVSSIQEAILDETDLDRLRTEAALATAYVDDGQVQQAIDIFEHLSTVYASILEPSDDDRLKSEHELAKAYLKAGQVEKAIEILSRVVAIKAEVLQESSPSRLASEHELASAYLAAGQVEKAIEILSRVVAIEAEVWQESHPHRLDSEHMLARAYRKAGRVEEALPIIARVVEIQIALPDSHPDRLLSEEQLAIVCLDNGQIDRAIQLQEHVLKMSRSIFKADHPSLLTSKSWLRKMYKARDRAQE